MIGHIITAVVCGGIALGLLIWGIVLLAGRGYRSIAGNSEASNALIEQQRKEKLGLGVGIAMIVIALVVGAQAVFAVSNIF